VQNYGPAGAAIWTPITLDPKLKRVYGATGNSYTDVDAPETDAVIAMELADGRRAWVHQALAHDDAVAANCRGASAGKNNCPTTPGPDLDFAAAPILRDLPGGKRLLLAGQKSGVLFAFDPDADGKLVWQTIVAGSSALGGIQYGFAADGQNAYIAVSDMFVQPPASPGGVVAVRLSDGKIIWRAPPPPRQCSWGAQHCSAAQDNAPAVAPGMLFAGSANGEERAYSTADGSLLWSFDTARAYSAVNGGEAVGGSVENGPQIIADGTLLVLSGYTTFFRPGNALIAFTPDGR
jgi:polyvinyl alcohol dehydrogenase (cytochrome)